MRTARAKENREGFGWPAQAAEETGSDFGPLSPHLNLRGADGNDFGRLTGFAKSYLERVRPLETIFAMSILNHLETAFNTMFPESIY